MIEMTETMPAGVSQIAHHKCDAWVTCSHEGEPYIYVGIQTMGSDCTLHAEVLSARRFVGLAVDETLKDWDRIKGILAPRGVERIIAAIWDEDTAVWSKFIKIFGFPEPNRCLVSELKIGG